MTKKGGFKKSGKGKEKSEFKGPGKGQEEAQPQKDYGKDFRGVVRLAGKDIRGELPVGRAVIQVKGIGERLGMILGDMAMQQLKLSNDVVIGLLTEQQMDQLEAILMHPERYGVPSYLLNRQKDPETGTDMHLIGTDVSFTMRQDVEKDKNLNTWRGYRHLYGQKVRGQHSRTSGRTGMTVGVLRKSIAAMKEAAAAEAGEEKGKKGGKIDAGEAKAPKEGAPAEAKPAAEKKGGAVAAGSGAEKKGSGAEKKDEKKK